MMKELRFAAWILIGLLSGPAVVATVAAVATSAGFVVPPCSTGTLRFPLWGYSKCPADALLTTPEHLSGTLQSSEVSRVSASQDFRKRGQSINAGTLGRDTSAPVLV